MIQFIHSLSAPHRLPARPPPVLGARAAWPLVPGGLQCSAAGTWCWGPRGGGRWRQGGAWAPGPAHQDEWWNLITGCGPFLWGACAHFVCVSGLRAEVLHSVVFEGELASQASVTGRYSQGVRNERELPLLPR